MLSLFTYGATFGVAEPQPDIHHDSGDRFEQDISLTDPAPEPIEPSTAVQHSKPSAALQEHWWQRLWQR